LVPRQQPHCRMMMMMHPRVAIVNDTNLNKKGLAPRMVLRRRTMDSLEGSLPFKKRRFLSKSIECSAEGTDPALGSSFVNPYPREGTTTTSGEDMLMALALAATTVTTSTAFSPRILSSSREDSSGQVISLTPVSGTKKRVHYPRLSSPLPNGCHGRTSRNYSYCRRQPCYNGSNYCKLHYQQYVIAGMIQSPSTQTENETASTISSKLCLSEGAPFVSNIRHQNRRYTGANNEARCQATTTRGLACANIAVHSTKYCYLHSNYDTHPPPRRGRATLQKFRCVEIGSRPGIQANFSLQSSILGQVAVGSLRATEIESRLPSLNMISTDQWFGKRVIVASGPLANQSGQVEKWGNGWVTVLIDGIGVHNRRSFELFLHPDQFSMASSKWGVEPRNLNNNGNQTTSAKIQLAEFSPSTYSLPPSCVSISSSSEEDEHQPDEKLQRPYTESPKPTTGIAHVIVSPQTPRENMEVESYEKL